MESINMMMRDNMLVLWIPPLPPSLPPPGHAGLDVTQSHSTVYRAHKKSPAFDAVVASLGAPESMLADSMGTT